MFQVSGTWVSGMQVSGGCSSATRMVTDFKIDGRVCDAFTACRARAATRGTESEHSTSLTPVPYTADDKSCVGPGNKARV